MVMHPEYYEAEKMRKKMQRIKLIAYSTTGFLFLIWLLCFKMISPGYTGIIINLFGEEKGASYKELGVGMHWIAPWKKVYEFPMFEQNHIWDNDKSFTFQTGEGLNVNADIGLSYHLSPGKVHTLFAKYRRGMEEITDLFIRNYARDAINKAASKMTVEDLYGSDKQRFIEQLQSDLKTDLEPIGISIDRVYLIGTLHFPSNVVAALNSKIEAVQRAQQRENELREAEAEARKRIAAAQGEAAQRTLAAEADGKIQLVLAKAASESTLLKASAEAQSNGMISESIDANILAYRAIQQWDGKVPTVIGTPPAMWMDMPK
jgi:regulator of protease activity HflC (stomatin/prohibitin superfamily)